MNNNQLNQIVTLIALKNTSPSNEDEIKANEVEDEYETWKKEGERRKRRREEERNQVVKVRIILEQQLARNSLHLLQLTSECVLFCIFNSRVETIVATPIARRRDINGRTNVTWWSITHPSLSDTPRINSNGSVVRESTFKEHYRITLSTFNMLVNILSETEHYAKFVGQDSAWPVWMQVAIVIWRFSNTHFGYRLAKEMFGVGHGSYNEFTNRFCNAMTSVVLNKVITWPTTVERTREIASGFARNTNRNNRRLQDVVGAIDGKLVIIQKPTKADNGNRYADRKGNISMGLLGVCDDRKRFINILTGVPGKTAKKKIKRYDLTYVCMCRKHP